MTAMTPLMTSTANPARTGEASLGGDIFGLVPGGRPVGAAATDRGLPGVSRRQRRQARRARMTR